MEKKELKISKRIYDECKNLSDKELGILVKSIGNYVFYGQTNVPKKRVLKAYFNMFKEKIDREYYSKQLEEKSKMINTYIGQSFKDTISFVLHNLSSISRCGLDKNKLNKDKETNKKDNE